MDHNELLKEIEPTLSKDTISQSDTESDASEISAPEPFLEDITVTQHESYLRRTAKIGTEVFIPYMTLWQILELLVMKFELRVQQPLLLAS